MAHGIVATTRTRTKILQAHGRANRLPMHFKNIGIVLWRIRKVASSSISEATKLWARMRCNGDEKTACAYESLTHDELAKLEGVRIVGLCRHPLARLVSGYYSPGFDEHYEWPEFVREVARIPDAEIEPHLRSQSFELPGEAEMWKLEEPGSWGRVQAAFEVAIAGRAPGLPNLKVLNRHTPAPWASYFDAELARIVEDRYAGDFDRFGYERMT